MASNFPKLPGFVPTHDPTMVSHKRVSHNKQEQVRNAKNQGVPLYALPRPPQAPSVKEKIEESKSFSQNTFKNHFTGKDITEQFEPTFVKLDKQVSFLCLSIRFLFIIIGPPLQWLFQRDSSRIKTWKFLCQEGHHFLLPWRSLHHDQRAKAGQLRHSSRPIFEKTDGAKIRRIKYSSHANWLQSRPWCRYLR